MSEIRQCCCCDTVIPFLIMLLRLLLGGDLSIAGLSWCDPPAHDQQNTISQVSHHTISWSVCTEQLATTSLTWRDIRSLSWLTM